MSVDQDDLLALVANFRERLESYRQDDGLSLGNFPRGACGDAAILLAHHLERHGYGPFRYIQGWHGEASHVWLSDGQRIIDITADQFEDFGQSVVIAETSPWHDSLNGQDQYPAAINLWGADWESRYVAAYAAIMEIEISGAGLRPSAG